MSSRRQGLLPKLNLSPAVIRQGMNLWPPFVGAGIRVTRIAPDFREVDVRLNLGLLNRNYFGTQFGGSVYAMTDPFFALMILRNLGPDYIVWDKARYIEYHKPARSDVFARFRLAPSAIARARSGTARGDKYEPTFTVSVVDTRGVVVAEVSKTLYIRRREDAPQPAPAPKARRAAGATRRKG